MKISNENEISRLTWLAALCVVLAFLAGLFYLFPEFAPVSPLPKPFTPSVYYVPHNIRQPFDQNDSIELSAVHSPALISLPGGIIFPPFVRDQISHVSPPLESSAGQTFFLCMSSYSVPDTAENLDDSLSSRSDNTGTIILSAPCINGPVFDRKHIHANKYVRVDISAGLHGKTINTSWLTLDKWLDTNEPWAVTLYTSFDKTGKPVRVFLVHGASDSALNAEIVRKMYQCRLSDPDKPCEGYVTIRFPGHGVATLR